MARRLPLLSTCALLAAASWPAQAAELGEPRVSSFLKQPLVADIELIMLEDPANPVQVRLASPNVYRGASIGMPAVLSTLRMSVMRRDGRQFLHVTSLGPVESEHLHLYLELADGTQRTVRLATLWLTPDPHPAPPPAPVPVAASVLAKAEAPEAKPLPRPAPAPKPAPKPEAISRPAPAPAKPKPVAAAPKAAEPALPKLEPAPSGAACAPQVRQQVDACVVLGAKNAMLREQLGQLEDKVRVLQVAVGASPAAVMPPAKLHKPKKKPDAPPEQGTPWLLAGACAGVLALLAAGALVLRRRRAAPGAAMPRVGLLARLKARMKRKPAPVAKSEPAPEKRAHDSSTQV